MLSANITLRPEIKNALRKCPVGDCKELPTDRLPDRMQVRDLFWCKPHADMLAAMISKQDYEDFVETLRKQGITQKPTLTDGRMDKIENRHCCVPRCKGGVITQACFEPYKQPGTAWTCDRHQFAVHHVSRQLNGQRLINALAVAGQRKSDPERLKREKAIRSAYKNHKGKPKYIEHVCCDLQEDHIKMPLRWLDRWKSKFGLRFEPYVWLMAYQERRIRHTIQKYISKICKQRNTAP